MVAQKATNKGFLNINLNCPDVVIQQLRHNNRFKIKVTRINCSIQLTMSMHNNNIIYLLFVKNVIL